MTIFLSKYSALETLAAAARSARGPIALSKCVGPHWQAPRSKDVLHVNRRCSFLSEPLQLIVPSIDYRRNLRHATVSVNAQVDRPGALLVLSAADPAATASTSPAIHPSMGICAPAFCLTQLASETPLPLLAELACALAGLYKFAPSNTGFVLDARAITTTASMRSWLDACPAFPGVSQARRALALSTDRLASVAETHLFLLLCLPKKLGGYGFPHPVGNMLLTPTASQRRTVSQQGYHPDLCWPDEKLIVEYDSDQHHACVEILERDAKRRNDLESLGYHVVSITAQILRRDDLFGMAADQIRRHLGLKATQNTESWHRSRRELRRLLFHAEKAERWWR